MSDSGPENHAIPIATNEETGKQGTTKGNGGCSEPGTGCDLLAEQWIAQQFHELGYGVVVDNKTIVGGEEVRFPQHRRSDEQDQLLARNGGKRRTSRVRGSNT